MKTYELYFHSKALKEWGKLESNIKSQFKKKLTERLNNPKVEKDKLRGYNHVYKIKLKTIGYRLAYQVVDNKTMVFVIVVGKREDSKIYNTLKQRYRAK